MRRVILSLLVFVLGTVVAGCPASGVGDPCVPAHPVPAPGESACPGAPAEAGCFVPGEVYIETRSLQCRTRVCMVYKWDERANPEQRSQRVFCTCRCGGEGDPSAFCQCPDDFRCTSVFQTGEEGIRGSYCVRCETLPGGCEEETAN